MVVPKIAMRYFASSVAIIKGGDRQLKFCKIRKYNNKYFAVRDGGIYELDDQYEYRYFKTGVYFYNFNNSKPLSLSGMQEVDEKLRNVGDATLFNKERHVETMRMIITIGWAIYPLGYVFGYLTGGVDSNTLNAIYNFADLINKIAFGLIIWSCAVANSSKR